MVFFERFSRSGIESKKPRRMVSMLRVLTLDPSTIIMGLLVVGAFCLFAISHFYTLIVVIEKERLGSGFILNVLLSFKLFLKFVTISKEEKTKHIRK
jgi:hypothetical protein